MRKLRALVVVRLSRQVDESTSAERQLADCKRLCEQMGWDVVGVAEDLNVSAGATTPFERPALREWIGNGRDDAGRSHEIDAMVFWRLDRLVRSMIQLSDVIRWADEYGVVLKSATDPNFDLSTQMGKTIASLVASFAEMELEAIRERITSDQHHRIREGNYRGSLPPWGYTVVDDPARGKILEIDPAQVEQINKIVGMLFDGKSLKHIARVMNEDGELTPRDRHNVAMGRPAKGFQWQGGGIKRNLLRKSMLGYIEVRDPLTDDNGKPRKDKQGKKIYGEPYIVTNDDGSPKLRAEPVMTRELYERVKAELSSRENQSHVTVRSTSLLLGVLHCGYCGAVAYRMAAHNDRKVRYRCRTRQDGGHCDNPVATIEQEYADAQAEVFMLGMMGNSYRRVRVWDRGEEHAEEIIDLEARLAELVPLLGTPSFKVGSPSFELLERQIGSVSDRLEDLKAKGERPAGWKWESTGERFSGWWESASNEDKNAYMRSAGLRIEYRNREQRKRGDHPDLNFIVEDVNVFGKEFGESATMKQAKKLLKEVPDGHRLEVKNGNIELGAR